MMLQHKEEDIMENRFYYFFWWIAGARVKYLKKHETEHEKYLHIGMTIFLTWLLATMGGTYAFYIIFGNWFALLGGLVWGLIIFNLDRYMMVTIKKSGTVLRRMTLSEKIGNLIQELIPTIPRILIALILGVLITTPLEVYIFKDQINNHIKSSKQALIAKDINQTNSNYIQQKGSIEEAKRTFEKDMEQSIIETKESIRVVDSQIVKLEKRLFEYPQKIEYALKKRSDSIMGNIEGVPSGPGPIADEYLAQSKRLKADQNRTRLELEPKKKKREKLASKLDRLEEELKEKRKVYSNDIAKLSEQQQVNINNYKNSIKFNGLVSQIGILHSTIDEQKKKKNYTLYHIHLILMTLIMIFETSPILFKILSAKGPYEMEMDSMSNKSLIESELGLRKFTVDIKRNYYNSD